MDFPRSDVKSRSQNVGGCTEHHRATSVIPGRGSGFSKLSAPATPHQRTRCREEWPSRRNGRIMILSRSNNTFYLYLLAKSAPFHKLVVDKSKSPVTWLSLDGSLSHLFDVSRWSLCRLNQIRVAPCQKKHFLLIRHRNLYTMISRFVQAKPFLSRGSVQWSSHTLRSES